MTISTRQLVLAALFTALMCVLTMVVRIFQPLVVIPFSLQPLVMLLAASLLPPRAAFLSMLAYLMLGLLGLPVFSLPPFGGIAYVLLPTFGFILAFPIAAWVQASIIKKDIILHYIGAGIIGIAIYWIIGLPYMYVILNFYLGKAMDVGQLLKIGFFPFIIFDLLKIIAAAWLAGEISKRWQIQR